MANGRRRRFVFGAALKLGVPVIMTVVLYTATIFLLLIPGYEDSVMERKREKVRQLTESSWSILSYLNHRAEAGEFTREEAQDRAIRLFRHMRFGPERKDYFWINDMHPHMVMHPYRGDLDGRDISDFQDPKGKHLFVEFVKVVKAKGGGWVPYEWQWKDDPNRIVPKISYVKGFGPWGWVIGTGIYVEDVRAEIAEAKRNLIWLSLAILGIITLLSSFVLWQGLRSETARRDAALALRALNEELEDRVEKRTLDLDLANQELESFNYAVSHDLRGPVHAILGYASLLQEDSARMLDPKSRGYVDHIFTSARRMTDMIEGLLQLSRLSRTAVQRTPVDLTRIAHDIVAELEVQGVEREVDFDIASDITALAHDALAQTVLENLLRNAFKYTRKEKPARIEFGRMVEQGESVYFVRDNGVGFDMRRSEHLFRPFRRLHADGEFEGSGIGLATVQRIIQRHRGRIWAESKPGEGATFYFTFGEKDL